MTMQRRDSQQLLDPERNIVISKIRNSSSTFSPVSSCGTKMTYEIPKHLDLSTTSLPMPDTKTLQVEQDRKPSITLTSYDYDTTSRTPAKSRPLLHLFRPIRENDLRDHATRNLSHTGLAAEEEDVSLVQLRADLEVHFQGLKREFEVMRGKTWTPLRPWANEEWGWDDEGGAEVEGVFDWCGK